MKRPTHDQIREEVLSFLAELDAEDSPYHDRSADAMADFLLEAKFSLVDEDCDWPKDFCHEYFEAAVAALIDNGAAT